MTTERNYSLYYLKHPTTREIRYVGITNCPERRLRQHLYDSNNRRKKKYPVNNWIRKLSKQDLKPQMEILKTGLTKEEAEQAEIETIALYRKYSNRMLNVSDGGNLTTTNPKHYEFIDPDGETIQIFNLEKFCRDNNLDQGAMHHVHSRKILSYKGWTTSLENREKMLKRQNKIFEFIDPEGNYIKTHNLRKFCRDNNLDLSTMHRVFNGKMLSYKGYTNSLENRKKMLKRQNRIYEFIDPEGNYIKTHNLHKFCEENNLDASNMYNVHNGKVKSHRGWTAANNMRID